jgi:hypothetical protein
MESSATLPYTLFLILAELGFGGLIVMAAVDVRGGATRGFVKATTLMVPVVLGLALWVALTLEGEIVEGYRLDVGPRDAIVGLMVALTAGRSYTTRCSTPTESVRRAGSVDCSRC